MDIYGAIRKLTRIALQTTSGGKVVEIQASAQTGAGPVVYSLPDAGDNTATLVEVDAAQTLTNKTLSSPTLSGTVAGSPTFSGTPVFSNITLPANSVGASQITDGSITNAELSASAAIARSKLDFGSGLVNADIAAAAAIARSKLASGTASHVVVNDGSGNLSSEAQLATSRGGTGVSSTATFPATGTVVTREASETLSGDKTFSGVVSVADTTTTNVVRTGGNTLGATLFLGTSDSNPVSIRAAGTARVRVNTTTAAAVSADMEALSSTRGWTLPAGTAAQRPSAPSAGTIRLNTDSNEFEGYANGAWQSVGGGLNELPQKNYLKPYATAAVAPGTLSTVAATGNIATTAGLFYADATSGSAALVQSSDTTLRGSANYLSVISGADTAGGRFVQFPAFALEGSDLGLPVSVSFEVSSSLADGDWDVVMVRYNSSGTYQEQIPIAGNASTGPTTVSAKVPTGTRARFRGFFVAGSTSGDLYAVRLRRLVGSQQVRLDTLYVGPQTQLVGAPVTDWQSYTPTTQGFGTLALSQFWWRRVGDSIEVQGLWTNGTVNGSQAQIGLPSGLTFSTYTTRTLVGKAVRNITTVSTNKQLAVLAVTGESAFTFSIDDYTATIAPLTAQAGSTILNSGDSVSFFARAPIANWSSNVTMADRAVEEYSSYDGSSVVFGANGSLVPNVAFAVGSTLHDVTFQTARQATDAVVVELLTSSGWSPANLYAPFSRGNNASSSNLYGVRGFWISATTYRVQFGSRGTIPTASNADNGEESWASLFASGIRYRVRKVSGGAVVGYPVGARNVVGDTTGTAVPSGYIGEQQRAVQTSSTAFPATSQYGDLGSITLTPGVWDVSATMLGQANGGTVALYGLGISSTSGNSSAGLTFGDNFLYHAFAGASVDYSVAVPQFRVLVTATTTYYAKVRCDYSAGTPQYRGRISAVRIA